MTCGDIEAWCSCRNEECDGIHECECGGSWERTEDGTIYHAFPGGPGGPADASARLLGWTPGI